MTIIDSFLGTITLGNHAAFRNLTMYALTRDAEHDLFYDVLDVALQSGSLTVSEVTDAGHVPEIKVMNHGARPVLIIDGEELVGAKQNRTVNLSILVAPGQTTVIPVTCVEAGRWHTRSARFAASPRTHFAEGHAAKSRQVIASLLAHGTAAADQGQVWDAIAEKSARLRTHSPTAAMSDMFLAQEERVEDYVRAIQPCHRQVGAIFSIDGRPRGLDLFDRARFFATLFPKLLRGYALDAIDAARDLRTVDQADHLRDRRRAELFLKAVVGAERAAFPAVGLGESWRFMGPDVSAGALTAEERIVHLSAFSVLGRQAFQAGTTARRVEHAAGQRERVSVCRGHPASPGRGSTPPPGGHLPARRAPRPPASRGPDTRTSG